VDQGIVRQCLETKFVASQSDERGVLGWITREQRSAQTLDESCITEELVFASEAAAAHETASQLSRDGADRNLLELGIIGKS
jgi:hypothetical protein